MQRRGRADVHQLHVRIGEHVLRFLENLDVRAEIDVAGTLHVAGDALENAVFRSTEGVAHGNDAGEGIGEVGAQVGHAHEAEADHGDVDGFAGIGNGRIGHGSNGWMI
jgi:hypothetical protein